MVPVSVCSMVFHSLAPPPTILPLPPFHHPIPIPLSFISPAILFAKRNEHVTVHMELGCATQVDVDINLECS